MAQGRENQGGGPERYPPVRQDDSVEPPAETSGEPRTFDPSADAPTPQGPRDQDPAEGKRD